MKENTQQTRLLLFTNPNQPTEALKNAARLLEIVQTQNLDGKKLVPTCRLILAGRLEYAGIKWPER